MKMFSPRPKHKRIKFILLFLNLGRSKKETNDTRPTPCQNSGSMQKSMQWITLYTSSWSWAKPGATRHPASRFTSGMSHWVITSFMISCLSKVPGVWVRGSEGQDYKWQSFMMRTHVAPRGQRALYLHEAGKKWSLMRPFTSAPWRWPMHSSALTPCRESEHSLTVTNTLNGKRGKVFFFLSCTQAAWVSVREAEDRPCLKCSANPRLFWSAAQPCTSMFCRMPRAIRSISPISAQLISNPRWRAGSCPLASFGRGTTSLIGCDLSSLVAAYGAAPLGSRFMLAAVISQNRHGRQ